MVLKRKNNRKVDETRPIVVKAGVIKEADGSALFSFGKSTAIAAVYGPRTAKPKWMQQSDKAILRTWYSMLPFSTDERVRPGPSRRSQEISKVIRLALEPAIFLEEYPKSTIRVFMDILEADAGTRTVAINAASVALADAGIPMTDLVSAVAAGRIGNEYVLDLEGKEEETTKCDLPVAFMPRTRKVTLIQMDGDISAEESKNIIKLALKGAEKVYEKQKQALRERWSIKE